jgi:hypothetical protein
MVTYVKKSWHIEIAGLDVDNILALASVKSSVGCKVLWIYCTYR